MNMAVALETLQSLLGTSRKYANEEVAFTCPFCHHYKPKLQINLNTQQWHCWVCAEAGRSLFSLLKKVNAPQWAFDSIGARKTMRPAGLTIFDLDTNAKKQIVELPKEFQSFIKAKKTLEYKHALHYLIKKRHMSFQDIVRNNVGFCEEGLCKQMVVFPSYDENHQLNFWVARDYRDSENGIKHRKPKVSNNIIGFAAFININEPITLVEGAFDANSVKYNVVPLYGKYIQPKLKSFLSQSKVKYINICLDPDAKENAMKIAEYFVNIGKRVKLINVPDDCDANEFGLEKLQQLIKVTPFLTEDDIFQYKLMI